MLAQGSQEKSLADKRRALLIKNAYLGLEKVENCHKVKSQRMKDQIKLRTLMRQYDRERYVMSLSTYRSQQSLKSRLGNMITQSELDLARVSGDTDKMKRLLEEVNERRSSSLAGPSAVEELLFQQILDTRRENIINMRQPENYSKRADKKGFWEEDEEFYKTFEGAIRNPFQMIDGMMEKYGEDQPSQDAPLGNRKTKPPSTRTKSLSAVEKVSLTKQRNMEARPGANRRGKSAMPAVDVHFTTLVECHNRTSTNLSIILDDRKKRLYRGIDRLTVGNRNDADILRALEKYENSQRRCSQEPNLPNISVTLDPATHSIKTRREWRKLFGSTTVPSLTWNPLKLH